MPTLNDLAYLAYSTNSGTDGTLNDVEVAYLQQVAGSSSENVRDLWAEVLAGLGYTLPVTQAQFEYWGDLGYLGTWNDRYYQWLEAGGTFGPAVQISASDPQPFCDYAPAGSCAAAANYTANDSGFTNPPDTWLWSLEPPVAGVVITNGTTKTCTVTSTLDADVTFNLKVVATDSVSTDTANRETAYTHYHRETLSASIAETIAGSCTWPEGESGPCTAEATYDATITGTPTSIVWSLSGITGGTATIKSGQGTAQCVIETIGSTTVNYTLDCDLTSEFQTANDSGAFSQTHSEEVSGPAFHALTPDPLTYEMKGVLLGTGGLTTTHTADLYAPDFEGVYRKFIDDEPVWSGGRVVNQWFRLTTTPADASQWAVSGATITDNAGTDPDGGNTAARIEAAAGWTLRQFLSLGVGNTFTNSFWVKSNTGASQQFRLYGSTSVYSADMTATTEWQRFEIQGVVDSAGGRNYGITNVTTQPVVDLLIWHPQLEITSGQTKTVASEYLENLTTSSPIKKTFANQNGNTVLNNVVTEAVGAPLAEAPYLQYYPAAQNELTYSRDLTQGWSNSGSVITYDQVGLTGEPNTASLIDDQNAGSRTNAGQQLAPPAEPQGTTITIRWFIKKTGTPTNYPMFLSEFASADGCQLIFNTETGTYNVRVGFDDQDAIEVIDNGSWWAILVQITNSDVTARVPKATIYPAWNSTGAGDGGDNTALGSAIVGNAEIHLNKTIAEVRGLGPIFTTTAAVATDAPSYRIDIANFDVTNQTVYFEQQSAFDHIDINNYAGGYYEYITMGASGRNATVSWESGWEWFRDGATKIVQPLVPGTLYKWAAVWSGTDITQNIDGVYGPEVVTTRLPYVPSYDIYLFNETNQTPEKLSGKMRELQFYTTTSIAEGKGIIDGLMA